MPYETLDDYEPMTYEEEVEYLANHVKHCTLHEQDVYCKVCNEY